MLITSPIQTTKACTFCMLFLHEYIYIKKKIQNQDANHFIFGHKHTHLKAVLPWRDIHSCQVNHVVELRVCVILQEGENRNNPFWVDHYLQLIKAGHLEFKQKDVNERTIIKDLQSASSVYTLLIESENDEYENNWPELVAHIWGESLQCILQTLRAECVWLDPWVSQ